MEQGFTLIDVAKPKKQRKPFKPKEWWAPKDVMEHYQVSAATVSRWKKKVLHLSVPVRHNVLSQKRWNVGLHVSRGYRQ